MHACYAAMQRDQRMNTACAACHPTGAWVADPPFSFLLIHLFNFSSFCSLVCWHTHAGRSEHSSPVHEQRSAHAPNSNVGNEDAWQCAADVQQDIPRPPVLQWLLFRTSSVFVLDDRWKIAGGGLVIDLSHLSCTRPTARQQHDGMI